MPNESPVFQYSRYGFRFFVYPNRVEVDTRRGCLGIRTGGKHETILSRTISSVSVQGVSQQLRITTSDGKKHDFNVGAKGDQARQAILSVL